MIDNNIRRAYADTPKGQIHYSYAGEGSPLLLLHHTASCSGTFRFMIPYLAPYCRVVAPDTPGYGMSYRVDYNYTTAEYAAAIIAFMDSMAIDKASIFGRHTGSSIACEIAAAYPERVDKLMLYGLPDWSDDPEGNVRKRSIDFPLKEDGSHLKAFWDDMTARVRENLFPRPYSKEALETINYEVLWKMMAGHDKHYYGITALARYNVMERVPLIKAPTLVFQGENDLYSEIAPNIAAGVRSGQLLKVRGGSYFTSYDDPGGLARHILDFLGFRGA